MITPRAASLLLAVLLALPASAAERTSDGLEHALSEELSRTLGIQEDGYPAPYYVSLTAIDTDDWEEHCQMGARGTVNEHRQRMITPDLRVGSYALDNHPIAPSASFAGKIVSDQDDEFALRHELWLALDGAYKSAAADFLRKQAVLVSRGKTEYDTDDLTRETPVVRPADRPASPWDTRALDALCASASGVFRGRPGLLTADATVRLDRQWSRLRDSAGSVVDFGRDVAEVQLDAVSISSDGMKLFASRRYAATSPAALPSSEKLGRDAAQMLADLKALSVVETTSPFSAPALLDPEASAAAVLAIAQRMSGEEQRNPNGAQTFRGKLGKRVLPDDLTLVDDPTIDSFAGQPLAGHYEFDDQGLRPSRVELIEKGKLENFLLSRYPVVGFGKSNGHGRAFPGYQPQGAPGSLFLTSSHPVREKRLVARLREECRRRGKPYGIWIRGLRTFVQQQGAGGHGSIRFMPATLYLVEAKTGKLTLVRDLDVVSTPLDLLNNIAAAGDDARVDNSFSSIPFSVVTPSLVLSDAELQRSETRPEKPPILPPPAPPAALASARVPFVPDIPYLQVRRYVLRGLGKPVTPFVMDGLEAMRQHGEGPDVIVEARLRGRSLGGLNEAARRMDRSIERLAAGARVETAVVVPATPQGDFLSRFKDGWPQ